MVIFGMMFYLFAGLTLLSAFLTLIARAPVHSALWLIFMFLNGAGLFVLLGSELLAMIFVIVYVGAVAVLFLFVVMMIKPQREVLKKEIKWYKRIPVLIGIFFGSEMVFILGGWSFVPVASTLDQLPSRVQISNTTAIGNILYTHYAVLFEIAGFILLGAMVGAIVLTKRAPKERYRQKMSDQVLEKKKNRIKICHVDIRKGV
ncbi:MAG: hypothetical protein B7Y25_02770 [Alphaproteobacteria bacterium 16-39-46]|nr:MAG: hypothetical protein B7Y25_02770 [Alphaproteobacteria bacterium 16-39-46]OZA43521.1 MAG: hypothetical protein B7X84_02940 [Alphaproteobacteria bacterium 17-39-52]HQS83836.1 NADH-quinone oxidoreductase subunit J [Alphaproteobacteria bacterium]HQS93701.1 NADH-quinone oxidoreductase subunit J [Alphaproteobacteria bacterium]